MLKQAIFTVLMLAAGGALAGPGHGSGHGAPTYSFGSPGKASEVNRTIEVKATDDMRFVYEPFEIRQGETIRFVVTNVGKIVHEFSIGDVPSQRAHLAMMKKMPDMKHEDDPTAVTLKPGETKEVIWRFDKPIATRIVFACFHPGHYEAGMKSEVAFVKK
ncbi:MAG TPA: cupredoxin family protein [Pelomicrobium sp.]|nr:cupredoxin family protein [Pelomicrobium sp.]